MSDPDPGYRGPHVHECWGCGSLYRCRDMYCEEPQVVHMPLTACRVCHEW